MEIIYYLSGYHILVERVTAHYSPWDWGQISIKLGTGHAM